MKICLNMIVRNEGARIERALASAAPYINSFVIVDTGSTDDTKEKIIKFFKKYNEEHGKPKSIIGEIRDAEFTDWSQARNAAIGWARRLAVVYLPDYLLLMDADMELVVRDKEAFFAAMTGEAHEMRQEAGALHYSNVRIVKANSTGLYRGATHEYYDTASTSEIGSDVAFFKDHADGSNRPEKFKRDIRLLKADLKKDPNNVRSFFYLAQSYADAGMPAHATKWYKRRVEAGGWDEEVWNAQYRLAHCWKGIDEDKFVANMLKAYQMRPTRAESMYDLAHYYRHKDMPAPALAAAEAVAHLPKPPDKLFVNDYAYKAGVKEEISITGFYVPGKRGTGFRASNDLSLLAGPYAGARELARANLYFYIEPLSVQCPSFKWANIAFTPEEGWAAMNPSITVHQGTMLCNVRTVNYRMDEQGRYLIRGTDGEANNSNPINTRNFILDLGSMPLDTDNVSPVWTRELLAPPLPIEFPPVIGFEDVRLYSVGSTLHSSATVRQIHPDGNCEQVRSKIIFSTSSKHAYITDPVRMLRKPRQTEKNWAPIVASYQAHPISAPGTAFMYRPLEIVDDTGNIAHKVDSGFDVGQISGSSQVIPFRDGWLAVVHEARYLGDGRRYYWHRFAFYSVDFNSVVFSRPFYFNDKVIEFCAGMCFVPGTDRLAISYGYKDAEARIATVSAAEVEKFLWVDSNAI